MASGAETRPRISSTGNETNQRKGSAVATARAGAGSSASGAMVPERKNDARKYISLIAITRVVQNAAKASAAPSMSRAANEMTKAGTASANAHRCGSKRASNAHARPTAAGTMTSDVSAL